ncbi:D-aminoacylase [Geodia barretti]|uniref:D-aminoacylase n=1 Tax=Geodia barretti TaxID=519541 RepID=A0AA35RMI1_GEOBA|nr:D-aminoacylase [Geodia barretti]
MAYDLLIKNGRVVDGSGGPAFYADVAVQNGKIVGVGKFTESAARTIDADGRVVAPGFIDHHTHYDPQALWDPLCNYTVQNGNTTVVVGQCGQTIAPARPGDQRVNGVNFTWGSIAEYLDALGQRRGVNVGALVGHSGVRRYVMGEAASERAEATAEEIESMKQLVREGMLAGALGFSTTPKDRDDPAGVAAEEERYMLGSVLGELGTGLFQWLEDSFREGIRAYGSCISITAGPIFNLRLGLDVPQDEDLISPHIMFAGMPTWDSVMARPTPERMRAFRDTEIRRALSAEAVEGTVAQAAPGTDRRGSPRGFFNRRWDLVEVFMAHQERNRQFEGKSVEQLAQEQGKGIMEAFLDLSLDEDLETHFLCVDRNVDVDSQRQILGSPYTVIGTTDGGARPDTMDRYEYSTNLLGYWVREKQIMSLEDAVYRLTGKTALMHELHDRGFIAPGKAADLTIFDADTIASKPREPVDYPPAGANAKHVRRGAIGIDYVIVNGEVLLEDGEHTGALPGQVLRGPLYQG